MVCLTLLPHESSYQLVEYPQCSGVCIDTSRRGALKTEIQNLIEMQNLHTTVVSCLKFLDLYLVIKYIYCVTIFLIHNALSLRPSPLAAVLYQLGPHQQDIERLMDLEF